MSVERSYGEEHQVELPTALRVERSLVLPLPVPATPLIGREKLVASIVDKVGDPAIRLIALTGPGGIGKTRLALAVAWELDREVSFVQLAAVARPDLVASTIAQTIGLEPISSPKAFAALRDALRDHELVLVLDNFEHLSQASLLVSDLLAGCPGLTILITSRSRLAISGENVIPIDPLEIPVAGSLERAAESEAVRLFVARAQAAHPPFMLNEGNLDSIARVCQSLDGLPLAIELAAARSNLLSPQALAARLEHRLQVLTDGPSDVPARLQTMRAAIAWSVDLLNEQEREIWKRLGVFSGGFPLESVEAVTASIDDDLDALIVIQSLIDQGLLRQSVNPLGEPRFGMLETTREYAVELLRGAGEEDIARALHAAHLFDYARVLETGLKAPDAGSWQVRTESEIANIRLAIGWFRDQNRIQDAMQLVARLDWFWTIPNFVSEGREWCEQLLERVESGIDSATLGTIFDTAGTLADWHNESAAAIGYSKQALQIWRDLDNTVRQAATLLSLGSASIDSFDFESASTYLHESFTLASVAADDWSTASSANLLGVAAGANGDHATSIQFHETALRIYQKSGHLAHSRGALNGLALGYLNLGEYQRSWENYEAVITLCGDAELYAQVPIAIEGFAQLAVRNQQIERGVRLLGAAAAQRKQLGLQSRPFIQQRLASLIQDTRSNLGDAQFALAWSDGQTFSQMDSYREARSVTVPASHAEGGLSRREREVLAMLVEGASDTEIADGLFISKRTASKHVAAILDKLGAGNRTAAATIAHRRGLT